MSCLGQRNQLQSPDEKVISEQTRDFIIRTKKFKCNHHIKGHVRRNNGFYNKNKKKLQKQTTWIAVINSLKPRVLPKYFSWAYRVLITHLTVITTHRTNSCLLYSYVVSAHLHHCVKELSVCTPIYGYKTNKFIS